MSITTKRGDDGCTDLLFNRRISKADSRIEAIGTVDELNAALGLVRAGADEKLDQVVDSLQAALVNLMGELAVLPEDAERYANSDFVSLGEADVDRVEGQARDLEAQGLSFDGWARPGANGNRLGAQLDVARTICRRSERLVLALGDGVSNAFIPLFLNRVSDLLWLLARRSESQA